MKKKLHYYLFVFSFLCLLSSCSKDTFDEYYARPDSLEDPIFQQLEARGNFTNLTALIDKAGYKDILSKAGYWTMMAPNDEAFTKFFQEKGISDVSKIDAETASKIVKYALIYNGFRSNQLSDYQSATGWMENNAFKRRTAYYDGFQTKTINGIPTVVVGSNRNGVTPYVSTDTNNKYISYYLADYFNAKQISPSDYSYFYPNKDYTGANVLGGTIKTPDIVAENGYIHEVDQVSLPLVNLDQYLESNSDYSLFYNVMEKNLVTYPFNQAATTIYHNFTGKSDNVYVKTYDPALPFALNNENYLKQADNDGQSNGYTLFAPTNAALQNFIDKVLLKNYASLDKLPKYIFQDLYRVHMVSNAVWPSKITSSSNTLGEDFRFNKSTDIKEAKVLSNGFFYKTTNKVQESNLFFSVYTSAYLNPKYSLVTKLFNDGSSYRELLSNIYQKYTLFLPSDSVLNSLGYSYDTGTSAWVYTSPINGSTITGSIARIRLMRVLYNCIVNTPDGALTDLSGSGIIRTGDKDIPGEYIKWKNNIVFAAGNEVTKVGAKIIGFEDQRNGRTYFIDSVLEISEMSPGYNLKILALPAATSQFAYYFNYLKFNTTILYAASGDLIQGVETGTAYTFIVPNNAAILKAVKAGVLPGNITTGAPNFNPTLEADQIKVANFIRYHILVNRTVSDDGLFNGQTETLLKNSRKENTYVGVTSDKGILTFSDNKNTAVANYIPALSNNLGDKCLIHLVDNYLLYTE